MLAEDVGKASGTNKQNEEVEEDESERMGAAEAWIEYVEIQI